MRAPTALTCVTTALLALAACSSDGDSPSAYVDAPSQTFTQVLGLVPFAVTGPVSYTDWTALDHRVTGFSRSTTTASWVRDATAYRDAVGVGPADAAWQVQFPLAGGGTQTITQWTDGSGLARLVESLRAHGWKQSTRDGWQSLTRSTSLTDVGWNWALSSDFLLDQKRGLLVQHPHDGALLLPGAHSVLEQPGVQAVVDRTPKSITGQIRTGATACPHYGLKERSPAPPESFVRRYFDAFGDLRPTLALSVAATSTDGRVGFAAVALRDPGQAAAELSTRQDATRRLSGGDPDPTVSGGRRVGAVDTFRLDSDSGLQLTDTVEHGELGVDSCGVR